MWSTDRSRVKPLTLYSYILAMHAMLIRYIENYGHSTPGEKEVRVIEEIFVPQKLLKKEFFLREGQVCKNMAFIVRGAMRQYNIEDDGTPHMVNLLIENWWAIDRESFAHNAPSIYNIDAWEDTDLLVASKTDWLAHQDELPAFNAISKKLDERHAIATQKRMKAMVSYTAEKRFADFKDRHPEFLDRFPQHLIASYLGITKETLSRIRRLTSKK